MKTLLVTFIFAAVGISTGSSTTRSNSTMTHPPTPPALVLSPHEFLTQVKEYTKTTAKFIGVSDKSLNKLIEIIDLELPESVLGPLFNQTKQVVDKFANRMFTAIIIDKSISQDDVNIIRTQANKIMRTLTDVFTKKP